LGAKFGAFEQKATKRPLSDGRLDARALAALPAGADAHALAPAAPTIEHEDVRDALRIVLDVNQEAAVRSERCLRAVLGRAFDAARREQGKRE
jgi:hypothetical protein